MHMFHVKRDWTADDLDDLPDDGKRYEVIDGELFVTPAGSLTHQEAVAQLHLILAGYLSRERVGRVVFAPADVRFSKRRAVQPDLFVIPLVAGKGPKRFEDVGRLLLAVEVLSPATARADRVRKRAVFREQGVPEYWIVDLDARVFERSTPEEARPEILDRRIEWRPEGAGAPLVIDLAAYFATVLED